MSGRTRDATACRLGHSIVGSSRTPTRTTRTPIRMHTSHTAIAVHRAATAMTPGTGSEPTSIMSGAQMPQIPPEINAASEPRRSQIVPFLFLVCVNLFLSTWLFFSLSRSNEFTFRCKFLVKLPGQPRQSTARVVKRFRLPVFTNSLHFCGTFLGLY